MIRTAVANNTVNTIENNTTRDMKVIVEIVGVAGTGIKVLTEGGTTTVVVAARAISSMVV